MYPPPNLGFITPEHVFQPAVDVIDAGVLVQALWVEDWTTTEQGRHGLQGVQRQHIVSRATPAQTCTIKYHNKLIQV